MRGSPRPSEQLQAKEIISMSDHVHGCLGDCEEGRHCWQVNVITPEDAERRGITLLTAEDVAKLCEDV